MDPNNEVQAKFAELAQTLCAKADAQAPGWDGLKAQFTEINGERLASVEISFTAAESSHLKDLDQACDLFSALRELMAEPVGGAWFSSSLRVGHAGDCDIKFNFDDRPRFDPPLSPDDYLEDLNRFPRQSELPYWHPAA